MSQPVDAAGQVGMTSYRTLPFQNSIFQYSYGAAVGLEPGNLFYQANPSSFYDNPDDIASAKHAAASLEAAGIVPAAGLQRWEDTYAASFPPGTFQNPPDFVVNDLNLGFYNKPEFVAWRNFVATHPQYWDLGFDGGAMPTESYYRSWGGQWGHISPLTPLDTADCPPGMTACDWGDDYAYRWSLTSALSGAYGLILSDFTDSQPDRPSSFQSFNPRIVSAFAKAYPSLTIQGATVPAQADWIVRNAFNQWNDFLSAGYGAFYRALALRVGGAAGRTGLVVDQCAETPSYRRMVGNDERILVAHINPRSYLCTWDDHLIQADRQGPVAVSPVGELSGFAVAAAREPRLRNGANLEADDSAYWQAIAQFYPTLDQATRQEVGYKLMKRLWLWSAWAHVADQAGRVRRALAYTTRDYWDVGTLSALDPLTSLIQSIVPTRPFGAALYYSAAIERAVERAGAASHGAGLSVGGYLSATDLQTFIDGGGPVGYYVSDAALGSIKAGTNNAPSAWAVIGGTSLLPPSELQALTSIAPVVSSPGEFAALTNQPLKLSAGLACFGFYDQNGRLILVISNPSTGPMADSASGTVTLADLGIARAQVSDLFKATSTVIDAQAGLITLPVSLSRWDTLVLAVTKPD